MSNENTRTVWKIGIEVTDEQPVVAPGLARVLHVAAESPTRLLLWVDVDPAGLDQGLMVHIRGTGHPSPGPYTEYTASVQAGPFVWHVYTSPIDPTMLNLVR